MGYIKDPKPEILRIEELVSSVKTGEIKLPKFQRPFVWNKKDVLTLLDSVYKGYPIGSILLWLTNEHLASERKIADLEINERPEEYPTNYILDGQQRLSSLCGALYWDGKDSKSIWNICFDLDKEKFFYPRAEENFLPEYFPLNKLINTLDFINQIRSFENHSKKDKFLDNAARLLTCIKDYKIAAVRIGDMSINEVAPIFERINSTGRRLTIVDLMRAATWSGGFDLNDAINAVRTSLEIKSFDDVTEMHILGGMSTSAGLGLNKDDIEKLRDKSPEELKIATDKCVKGYELAVDFLTNEFPLSSFSYLPYSLQLNLLVEFFNLCNQPSIKQRNLLKDWFWQGAFSRYFRGFNSAQINKDLAIMRAFAKTDVNDINIDINIKYTDFTKEKFFLRSAPSKAFALLLAQNNPRSLLDGSAINTRQALSIINRLEFHHIFPIGFLKSSNVHERLIDAHANICMLNSANNKKISKTRPSVYFKDMETLLEDKLEEVLMSNYISIEAYEAGLRDDYDNFLEIRSKLIMDAANNLAHIKMDVSKTETDETNTGIDADQNEIDGELNFNWE